MPMPGAVSQGFILKTLLSVMDRNPSSAPGFAGLLVTTVVTLAMGLLVLAWPTPAAQAARIDSIPPSRAAVGDSVPPYYSDAFNNAPASVASFNSSLMAGNCLPKIAQVSSGDPASSSATITWMTSCSSDSQVEYGPTSSYGFMSSLDVTLSTTHAVTLSNLLPDTVYYYRVVSKTAMGHKVISDDFTVRTLTAPPIPTVYASAYPRLQDTLTAIGDARATLVIADALTVKCPDAVSSCTVTTSPRVTLRFIDQGRLVLDPGVRVTIRGPLQAPLGQIVSGSGCLLFRRNRFVNEVYPQWWGASGDGVQDDTLAIQQAIDAVGKSGGGTVFFPPGTYRTDLVTSGVGTPLGGGNGWALGIRHSNTTLQGVPGKSILRITQVNGGGYLLHVLRDVMSGIMPDISASMKPQVAGARSVYTITPSDAGQFALGDYVLIRTGQLLGSSGFDVPDAEVNRVTGVKGTTGQVALAWPLTKAYTQERYPLGHPKYPNLAPLGIAKITHLVLKNIHLRGLTLESTNGRVMIAGRFVVGGSIEDSQITTQASVGSFGSRFIRLVNNRVHIDGSGVWFAPDTTNTDMVIANNLLTATGDAALHLHEGTANITVSNNVIKTLSQYSATNAISGMAKGYRHQITDNSVEVGDAGSVARFDFFRGLIVAGNRLYMAPGNTQRAIKLVGIPYEPLQVVGNTAGTHPQLLGVEDPGSFSQIAQFQDGALYSSRTPVRGTWRYHAVIKALTPSTAVAGWINARAGRAAPTWQPNKRYLSRWQAQTAYPAGASIIPDDLWGADWKAGGNSHRYEATTAGVSGSSQPIWPKVLGATVTDGGVTWQAKATLASQFNWREADEFVMPTLDNGHVYRAMRGGTSDVREPSWPTNAGGTVVDGSVTWQEVGASAQWMAYGTAGTSDMVPPVVYLSAPLNLSTVADTIAVSATAFDEVGVAGVQFFVDGVPIAAEAVVAPYYVSWPTDAVENGPHVLSVRARDAAGNTATATVNVTVNNRGEGS